MRNTIYKKYSYEQDGADYNASAMQQKLQIKLQKRTGKRTEENRK